MMKIIWYGFLTVAGVYVLFNIDGIARFIGIFKAVGSGFGW